MIVWSQGGVKLYRKGTGEVVLRHDSPIGSRWAFRPTRALVFLAFLLLPFFLHEVFAESQTETQDLLAQADQVLHQLSELTGLPIKASLQKQIISRPEIRKYLMENLRAEMSPREMHVQEATLKAFGLVSREFNLEDFLINFYTEQAAGFYDPRHKTMFIADWPSPDMQRLVLAHELTHALQDQNFGLDNFLHAARSDDDASSARQAVAEGHATAAMFQVMVQPLELASLPSLEPLMTQVIHQQYEEFPAFSKAPYFLRQQAMFPYVEGVGFMQRGLKQGGWKLLSSLFKAPPTSTKEIFEPTVYFDKQPLPKAPLEQPGFLKTDRGLELLAENTMGELGYYALLGQFISDTEANSVGKGWLADRYLLYEASASGPAPDPVHVGTGPAPAHASPAPPPAHYVLVARTRWSSPEIALAFFRDYHTILARKYPELAPDKRSVADLFIGTMSYGAVILLRRRDECLWAEGISPAQTDSMLEWLRSR
jgi:uncharacterized protein DUF6782